ncbi:serine/threonine protein kinase [Capronia epimyces CBS 606.96]|uniref:Serine/threonine protein kinase n=1 Tax=Capronia epimyces CBS 606.96 TaxID=1182542 RepID=W9YR99_9EURO|nr:serine/threonine protein kinase [Capronia epimyces CBS 606.96]EXJ84799.1 serine/threonine protein kinase [Capronia epimyces CBS 606.96]
MSEQPDDMEYINEINRRTLENEIQIYQRLGHHDGIISCLGTSNYGIELAFAKQGNLEDYIQAQPEPQESLKIEWILSVIDTLSYVHSQGVLVDEIALRNFLVADGQLKLTDFGQSSLLPLSTDMDTICDNDLTTTIEILHLGWVIYSIAVWHVHKYYFFDKEHDMQWPNLQDLPPSEGLFCRTIVERCWNGQYINMKALKEEAYETLVGGRKQSDCCR